MRKALLFLACIALGGILPGQVPAGFKYQAVVRDGSGAIVVNKAVSFRISIIQGITTEYAERHYPSTNEFGLVNLDIGTGTVDTGTFGNINWGAGQYFIKIELDATGGNNFQVMGTTPLQSVPYALHAKTVEIDKVDDADSDPANEIQTITLTGNTLSLSKGGGSVSLPDTGDNWGSQFAITDPTLSGNGTASFPLGLAQLGAGIGQVLKWTGMTWMPDNDQLGINFWQQNGGNIFFNTGKVGIGTDPGGDLRHFQVNSLDMVSVTGINSSTLPTAYFRNNSTGPAAIFDAAGTGPASVFNGKVAIIDGSQGAGKVLTSDASGFGSWQAPATNPWVTSGNKIYYNGGAGGFVGIGTSTPYNHLDIIGDGHARLNLKAPSQDAIMYIDRKSATHYGAVDFRTDGLNKFWVGMLADNNFKISTSFSLLKGLEVAEDGNVSLSDNLSLESTGKIGIGVAYPSYSIEINGGSTSYEKFFHSSSGEGIYDGLLIGISSSGNTGWMWNYEAGGLHFGTSNLTRMVIGADGRVGIGVGSPGYKVDIAGNMNLINGLSGQALMVNGDEALWYNGTYFSWGYGGTYNYFGDKVAIGTSVDPGANMLVVNGAAAKPGGGSWATWSDARLKDIHGDYVKGLKDIAALQPVRYSYKNGNSLNLPDNQEYAGLIAQEVEKVFPEAISKGPDGYLQIDLNPVNIALINAIRELKEENDRLKKDFNLIKAENAGFRDRLTRIENLLNASAKK